MEFKAVRHLWGLLVSEWEPAFQKIQDNGYIAVETCPHLLDEAAREKLKSLCVKHGLKLVYQIHTDSYLDFPVRKKSVADHLATFKSLLEDASTNFGDVLLFVNSHSGYDGWKREQVFEFFAGALQLSGRYPFDVCHETHRSRIMYNPWITEEIIDNFPNIKITADLSHWFCVLERAIDSEIEIIEKLAHKVHLIHGRVGHNQGPQVPDPKHEHWQKWLVAHEKLWDLIWTTQKKNGVTISYFEPEFGPPPYCWVTGDGTPQVNVWDVCEWVTTREHRPLTSKEYINFQTSICV